jgi:septal ring factor EnvC (AmiA/AmiB activator)
VQRLLPLLEGNLATAATAITAIVAAQPPRPAPTPPPAPVQVNLEPVERGLAEVRTSNRELRNQFAEQATTLKRVEDQLDRVREATDRNTLEQQELIEDLRAVGSRVSTFAILGLVLLAVSLLLNGYLIFQLQHILH